MISAESMSGAGTPTFLLTNDRQHKPEDLAKHLVREIFNTSDLEKKRATLAQIVEAMMARKLAPIIAEVINRERAFLKAVPDYANRDYAVEDFVDSAINTIHDLPEHPWAEKLKSDEWTNAAKSAIGNILATAIHIERSWFASDHPDNRAAQSYTARFQGHS